MSSGASESPPEFRIDPEILHDGSLLVRYKVRTGDSLQSLAGRFGWTWQQLARLNWGTDNPTEINWCLHHYVGCRKNAAGHYVFSDEDDPGVVWLPFPLPTVQRRIVRGTFRVGRYPIKEP